MQWRTRGIVRQNVPCVQRGGDLAGQHTVRGDNGGLLPVFDRLSKAQGDGQCFAAGAGRFNKRHVLQRVIQIGQLWPFGQPCVGDGCGA